MAVCFGPHVWDGSLPLLGAWGLEVDRIRCNYCKTSAQGVQQSAKYGDVRARIMEIGRKALSSV